MGIALERKGTLGESAAGMATLKELESEIDSTGETISNGRTGPEDRSKGGSNGGEVDQKSVSVEIAGEVCRIEDSPFRILKVAASGNLKEFERLYKADNSRLHLRDSRGQTVVHHAASKSKTNVLDFILQISKGPNINARDKNGCTPLHIAVERNQVKGVKYLLEKGVDSTIHNNKSMAPIHVAVEFGYARVLEALLSSGVVDGNQEGPLGITAIHLAATADTEECAKVLTRHQVAVMARCSVGYLPIHVAARSGSHKVLEVLLTSADDLGYTKTQMLAAKDKDGNAPLHAAVNSGDIRGVTLCLQYGASIGAQQNDESTPVHSACSQGRLDMVTAMLQARTDSVLQVLRMTDSMEMTPLHVTALFDQAHIAEYLITMGADVDAQDKENRTPLLLAASKQGWRTVKLLLSKTADLSLRDKRNRNFLHLAILNGAKLQDFGEQLFNEFKNLLNERDDFGCTPMHYASREGHLSAIEDLITLGAYLNIKNNDKQSPLHFAARYGRLNTALRLLSSSEGQHIINETDGHGLTALHIASQNGHVKVVQCLVQKGAALHRDHFGNTPLHLAAKGYTQTIRLLLSVHAHILNARNQAGETALHIAAKEGQANAVSLLMSMNAEFCLDAEGCHFFDHAITRGQKEVATSIVTHERWEEAMRLTSTVYCFPIVGLIKHLPEVCLTVLDQCQTPSGHDEKTADFHYHYDFRYLQPSSIESRKDFEEDKECVPMFALNMMVKFNRVECLSHPVCVNYLKMKWKAYGFLIHMANIGIYIVFLAFLTTYVTTLSPMNHSDPGGNTWNQSTGTEGHFRPVNGYEHPVLTLSTFHKIEIPVLISFCVLNMLKEIGQMIQQKGKYFRDFSNAIEWMLYVTSALFIVPTVFGHITHHQWECGAIAVFLAWFNFLLYLQRFDFSGIYVVMFLEILRTLVQVIAVFSILIIAFGLAFYILLCGEDTPAHRSPSLSLMRTFIMMLGEIDYIPIFIDPQEDGSRRPLHFGALSFIFLFVFVLLMPILLMNLLIGLAVGDIEAVQRNARLKRLAMQVELHTDLERKLPKRLLRLVDKTELNVYMSYKKNFCSWIVGRMFRTAEGDHAPTDGALGSCNSGLAETTFLLEEFHKQKQRLKDLSANMDKQYELLRLIVQKMEIHAEAEERDVGDDEGTIHYVTNSGRTSGWSSSTHFRQSVRRSSFVVSRWPRGNWTVAEE